MATRETLGVAIVGAGWCALQHIAAVQRNPRTRITWIFYSATKAAPFPGWKANADRFGVTPRTVEAYVDALPV